MDWGKLEGRLWLTMCDVMFGTWDPVQHLRSSKATCSKHSEWLVKSEKSMTVCQVSKCNEWVYLLVSFVPFSFEQQSIVVISNPSILGLSIFDVRVQRVASRRNVFSLELEVTMSSIKVTVSFWHSLLLLHDRSEKWTARIVQTQQYEKSPFWSETSSLNKTKRRQIIRIVAPFPFPKITCFACGSFAASADTQTHSRYSTHSQSVGGWVSEWVASHQSDRLCTSGTTTWLTYCISGESKSLNRLSFLSFIFNSFTFILNNDTQIFINST